jgi:hypothetical protein
MGNLAAYLQGCFQQHCPPGWQVGRESHFISPAMERLLGYAPRADLLLANADGSRRLWIEFEVSRADPVANHAKFATSHLFSPFPKTDTFVSMVSSHIDRGRRNLAAHTILLLRHAGLDAYQMPLLPSIAPNRIKELNHTSLLALATSELDVGAEVHRAITLSQPILAMDSHKILFASNVLEVLLNAERWNHELQTDSGRALWGKRRCQYFVFNKQSQNFAPAKFCAFVDAGFGAETPRDGSTTVIGSFMPLSLYASLDESEPRFDGHVAWKHLVNNLSFSLNPLRELPEIEPQFAAWLNDRSESLSVKARDAIILLPPSWE